MAAFIAFAAVAVAIFLPAWAGMHHPGESFELELAIAGCFAALGTMFGTITVYAGEWDFQAWFFYLPWILFGTASCAVLVIGMSTTASLGWQIGLGAVMLLQLATIFIPVIFWRVQNRRERNR
jgi:hypothetical protein